MRNHTHYPIVLVLVSIEQAFGELARQSLRSVLKNSLEGSVTKHFDTQLVAQLN